MKKLNFACGEDIRDGWDNSDWQKDPKVIFCNANKFPYPFRDNTYDYVFMKQCLILFDNPRNCLLEIHRICKNKAIIEIQVAHCSNKGRYNDLDVKHDFSEKTFQYFVENNCRIEKKERFKIKYLEVTPTIVGKFIPRILRKHLSSFIDGLNEVIIIKLEVIK